MVFLPDCVGMEGGGKVALSGPSVSESDDVALEPFGFAFGVGSVVDLVEIGADAEEDSTWGDRGEIGLLVAVRCLEQVADAFGFGEETTFIEGIDEDFAEGGLMAAEEVAGHSDADDREFETSGDEDVDDA